MLLEITPIFSLINTVSFSIYSSNVKFLDILSYIFKWFTISYVLIHHELYFICISPQHYNIWLPHSPISLCLLIFGNNLSKFGITAWNQILEALIWWTNLNYNPWICWKTWNCLLNRRRKWVNHFERMRKL